MMLSKVFMTNARAGNQPNSTTQTSNLELLLRYEKMLLNIRKDLGHQNQNLGDGSILGIFIQDIDDYIAAKSQVEILNQTLLLPKTEHKPENLD